MVGTWELWQWMELHIATSCVEHGRKDDTIDICRCKIDLHMDSVF
jgi:hypothetical protein